MQTHAYMNMRHMIWCAKWGALSIFHSVVLCVACAVSSEFTRSSSSGYSRSFPYTPTHKGAHTATPARSISREARMRYLTLHFHNNNNNKQPTNRCARKQPPKKYNTLGKHIEWATIQFLGISPKSWELSEPNGEHIVRTIKSPRIMLTDMIQ